MYVPTTVAANVMTPARIFTPRENREPTFFGGGLAEPYPTGTHSCQPGGAGGHEGSGSQPGGGIHPAGGTGHPGGGLNRCPVPAAGSTIPRTPAARVP